MRRFAKRIARAGTEPKHWENQQFTVDMVQGDGTTPIVHIRNLPSNLVQGDEEDQFHGNQVFLKGVGLRVAISAANGDLAPFSDAYVRYTLLFSRTNASNMTGAGTQYLSTTTSTTNPTQVPPLANPRLWDSTTAPFMFTGVGYETFFDRTNVKVLATKLIKVNSGGAGNGMTLKKLYFRINKPFQFQNPDASPLTTAPNHGKYGSYYLITQVYVPLGVEDPGENTPIGFLSDNLHLYFRDP